MTDEIKPCMHFVGFRDKQKWTHAVRVFGEPDFVHYVWDQRAQREIADVDMVLFAKGTADDPPSTYSFDDSAIF